MKLSSRIMRIIAIILAAVSLYLLLLSSATLKIDNTHKMAETVVDRVVKNTNNPELKDGVRFVRDSGLQDVLINDLPKKWQLNFSYADIYHLSRVYDEKGKVSANDIGLSSKNKLEEVLNTFIVGAVNDKLKEESEQVYHLISIYRYSIFIIILLYLLGAILIWLKKYWASLPLLIGSISSFGALWYFCHEASEELQEEVYRGISINLEAGIWIGLLIALIVAIAWPFMLKMIRKGEIRDA